MKVLLVTESVGPESLFADFSYELAEALSDLGHKVSIATSQTDFEHPKAQILTPFRKWGALDIQKAIFTCESVQPDAVHVVQPHGPAEKSWLSVIPAILSYCQMKFGSRGILHLLDENRLKRQRSLVEQIAMASSVVTTTGFPLPTSRGHRFCEMGFLRRKVLQRPERTKTELLIPAAPTQWIEPEKNIEQISQFVANHPDWNFRMLTDWSCKKNTEVKRLKGLVHDLPVQQVPIENKEMEMENASAALLFLLNWDIERIYQFSQACISRSLPALINPDQIRSLNSLWQSGENCQVLESIGSLTHLQFQQDEMISAHSALSRIYADS